jgi:phosphoglycolate phosphatase
MSSTIKSADDGATLSFLAGHSRLQCPQMIRNILFDWSGTLVDDLPAVWKATNYVFQQAGLEELSLERFRAEFCLPFQKFYDRFTPNVPMAQLEAWFHGHFGQAQDSVMALPHVPEFLEYCRQQGVRMFVLSTMHPEHFSKQADALGLAAYFERTYVGVMDKAVRIRSLLEENHLNPDETMFIGDMQHDIDTAKHGGVLSCAVLTGYTCWTALRASAPDLLVEHLGELKEILTRHGWDLRSALENGYALREERPVPTVGALIFNSTGQVLMIRTRKWSNLWGIPGGKVRFGESSLDALHREIKEETGLEIEDVQFVLVQDCIHSPEFYRDAHFLLLNYTCRCVVDRPVELNDEAQEFQWVTPMEAHQLPLNIPTRVLLDRVAPLPKSS